MTGSEGEAAQGRTLSASLCRYRPALRYHVPGRQAVWHDSILRELPKAQDCLTECYYRDDQDSNAANLQTFNPLFPTGAYFNLADPVGPSNFIHLHPVLDLFFGKHVTATAKWAFFWRESLHDGVYRLSVVPLRTGQQSRKRYVGNSPSLTVVWTPTRHATVHASYVHFFAGPFLEETPPGKDIDYVTVWFAYKF